MLVSAHFAVGAAIGISIPGRLKWTALPAALGSHYVLDAIPHFEQANVMGRALGIAPDVIRTIWIGPWAILFAGMLAWMLYRAMATREYKWWGFIALCGLLAAVPDVPNRMLPPTSGIRNFHNAMHAHHDWGTSLHRSMTGESIRDSLEAGTVSGWFYVGMGLEALVEFVIFAVGALIVFRASQRLEKANPPRAGPSRDEQE